MSQRSEGLNVKKETLYGTKITRIAKITKVNQELNNVFSILKYSGQNTIALSIFFLANSLNIALIK